MQDVIGVAFN